MIAFKKVAYTHFDILSTFIYLFIAQQTTLLHAIGHVNQTGVNWIAYRSKSARIFRPTVSILSLQTCNKSSSEGHLVFWMHCHIILSNIYKLLWPTHHVTRAKLMLHMFSQSTHIISQLIWNN